MSCNVGQYLPPDDSPDDDIERIVHSNLDIMGNVPSPSRSSGKFRSKERLELRVESDVADDLVLRAYRRKGGDLMAELHYQNAKIRALHTHYGHRNPGSNEVLPNGHMHFPTVKRPLAKGSSSYAYELDCSDDEGLFDIVISFCALLNIHTGNFHLPLDSYGRG